MDFEKNTWTHECILKTSSFHSQSCADLEGFSLWVYEKILPAEHTLTEYYTNETIVSEALT